MIHRYVDEDIGIGTDLHTSVCTYTQLTGSGPLESPITPGFGEKAPTNFTCACTPGCERSWSGVTRTTAATE